MSECKRCLLPEGKFAVALDTDRTCNYCDCYDRMAPVYADPEKLRPRLVERLEKVRGKYAYDALVGISGGKDSTYVLYRMVKEYGAKVLAFTYENGFLTDLGKRNVENAVRKLGVDHFFHYPDWNVHRTLYRVCLEKLGDPCLACAFAGYFLTLKICSERRIPFFVMGRSPSQMFRNLFDGSKDLFLPMIRMNAEEHSFEKVAATYRKLNDGIKAWVGQLVGDERVIDALNAEFFIDSSLMTAEFAPEILSFFLYEPYDEEAMKRVLERELGYERSANYGLLTHLDCGIHDAAEHLYHAVNGLSMVAQEVAVMRRRDQLTEAQARALLARKAPDCDRDRSIATLCDRLGVDAAEFPALVDRLRESPPSKFESR